MFSSTQSHNLECLVGRPPRTAPQSCGPKNCIAGRVRSPDEQNTAVQAVRSTTLAAVWLSDEPVGRGRNPRCFNGLPYRCGFPQITIVCQQIRGHTVRVLLEPAAH